MNKLSIEEIGYEDRLGTFFRIPVFKDTAMPSANFVELLAQKRPTAYSHF